MKRLTALILSFGIGVCSAYLVLLPDRLVYEDIAPVDDSAIYVDVAVIEEEQPNYVPFFDSIAEDKNVDMWLIPGEFSGMDEVWTVLLISDDSPGKEQWSATVLTKDANGDANETDDFSAISLKAAGDRLSFETKTQRGIKYTLEGSFLYGGSNFYEGEKVFRGTMKKFVKDKLKAQFTDTFGYHEPRCWH